MQWENKQEKGNRPRRRKMIAQAIRPRNTQTELVLKNINNFHTNA